MRRKSEGDEDGTEAEEAAGEEKRKCRNWRKRHWRS
jgi:hypothetical protein